MVVVSGDQVRAKDRTQVTSVALDYGCMSSENGNKVTEQRIALPKPDAKNITVLTSKLPNEPILPWHHYDSPWMGEAAPEADEMAEAAAQAGEGSEVVPVASDLAEEVKQLTLALEADTGAAMLPDDERLTPPEVAAEAATLSPVETPPHTAAPDPQISDLASCDSESSVPKASYPEASSYAETGAADLIEESDEVE